MSNPKITTARGKAAFVRNLIRAVEADIRKDVEFMPETWDGHELREYIAEKFEYERSMARLAAGGRRRRIAYNRATLEIPRRRWTADQAKRGRS